MTALHVAPSFAPLAAVQECTREEANAVLVAWGHQDGPIRRPPEYGEWCHILLHEGRPLAVAVASALIRDHVAGWAELDRANTVELSRLCAARRDLCRAMLRLWRELVFPALPFAHAVSYQHTRRHSGDLYRFDGWTDIGKSSSGTDQRTGRKGSPKRVWGWALPDSVRAELRRRQQEAAA